MDRLKPVFNTAQVAGNNFGCRRTEAQLEVLRQRPQSCAKLYDFDGEQLTVPQIAARLGTTNANIYARLRKGGGVRPRVTQVFQDPIDIGGGRMLKPREIAEEFALPLTTVYSRLKLGWTGAALTQSRKHKARNSR